MIKVGSICLALVWGIFSPSLLGATSEQADNSISPELVHARVAFRLRNYHGALRYLIGAPWAIDSQWIKAESLFRLKKFGDAQKAFEEMLGADSDPLEVRKITLRIFDCELLAGDMQAAINRYLAYKKQYTNAPAKMTYGLGKALLDVGYSSKAMSILRAVPKGSEYFMRARYLVATLGLDSRTAKASLKFFRAIENQEIISVEDHAVKQMSILAQARIYAAHGRDFLAEKIYARVALDGDYGEKATAETVRIMLARAKDAQHQEGRFKKASVLSRDIAYDRAIGSAYDALQRFRKVREISFSKPELLALMAHVMVESKRYDEARVAYGELIDHYRPLQKSLADGSIYTNEIWPYFAIDYLRAPSRKSYLPMIGGIPDSLVNNLADLDTILALRDRIEESGRKLRDLDGEIRRRGTKSNSKALSIARANQQKIQSAYQKMVIKKQKEFRSTMASRLNTMLAEAEYKRGDLALREIQGLKKQMGAARDFQANAIRSFEDKLKKIDEGGS